MLYFLAFAVGAGHAAFYAYPLPLGAIALIIVLLLVAQIYYNRFWLGIVAACLFGTALGSWQVQIINDRQLPHEFEGTDHLITFSIESIPKNSHRSSRFLARVLKVECVADACPDLVGQVVRLGWYQSTEPPQAGQIWQALVRLKRPRGFVNPGGFDYQAWVLGQDVSATGYIRPGPTHFKDKVNNLASIRGNVKDAVLADGRNLSYKRFYAALLVGDQGDLKADDWATLQATGTIHLMAISGLHIGIIAMWGFALGALGGRVLGACSGGSGLLSHRWVSPVFSCLLGVLYAALAGFSIPTQRAVLVCLLANLGFVLGIRANAGALLALVLAMVTVTEPLAWTDRGFWLSFLAVAVLLFALGGRIRRAGQGLLSAQWVLAIGLLLPLLILGQPASLVSPAANLLAVPLVSLVVVPGLFIAALLEGLSPFAAQAILQVVDFSFHGLWLALEWLAHLPQALWWPKVPLTPLTILLGSLGIVLLLTPTALRVQMLGALLLLGCLFSRDRTSPELKLSVLDVGQGLAVVIEQAQPKQTWLFDAGPRYSDDFEAGGRIIAPYLMRRGVGEVSLIVSHRHVDHSGGALGLAARIPVRRLLYGDRLEIPSDTHGYCRAGQSWQQGRVLYQILWPDDPEQAEANPTSCVLLLTLVGAKGVQRILLTGDIGRREEWQILERLPKPIDIVVAPHHGSRTSSSLAFIEAIEPRYVVFSAGFRNRHGHPHASVVERYRAAGATTFNTATDGAIIFSLDGGDLLNIKQTRVSEARLWHGPVASSPNKSGMIRHQNNESGRGR